MVARWAVFALLLASLSSVFFIPSDSVVEKKIKLPSIGLPALPSIDHADNERRSNLVVETKIEQPSSVSLPLPFIVYYANILSLATIRFLMVLRPIMNNPFFFDREQKCVKPRKSKVSGFPPLALCAPWPRCGQSGSTGSCPDATPIRTRANPAGTLWPRAHVENQRLYRRHSG